MRLILLETGQKMSMQAEQALHVRYLWRAGWSGKLSQLLLCTNNLVIALQSTLHSLQKLQMQRQPQMQRIVESAEPMLPVRPQTPI